MTTHRPGTAAYAAARQADQDELDRIGGDIQALRSLFHAAMFGKASIDAEARTLWLAAERAQQIAFLLSTRAIRVLEDER